MRAHAAENDPSSTATIAEPTFASAWPNDVFLQKIVKPTFGDHPITVLLIYFLVVVAYVFKCRYDLSAPYCPAINYAFVFVMTSPTAFLLYMLYKRHSLDRASARRQVSVTDVEPVTVLPAIAEARSDMGA